MRALVIGASGQVGAALLEALRARGHEATGTYAHHAVEGCWPLDITDARAVEHAVFFVKPKSVVRTRESPWTTARRKSGSEREAFSRWSRAFLAPVPGISLKARKSSLSSREAKP